LSSARQKAQAASCLSNVKQIGLAWGLYSDDYNSWLCYDGCAKQTDGSPTDWDDNDTPLLKYLAGGNPADKIRQLRLCPARRGLYPPHGSNNPHNYTMPIGQYRQGFSYTAANAASATNPYYKDGHYWPSLKSLPNPSKFLLIIESKGNTITCGNTALNDAVTKLHSGTGGDSLPAIQWHAGVVNCLFGDFHAENLNLSRVSAMDGNCTAVNPPNFYFAMQ
jgi:hypothetical protein